MVIHSLSPSIDPAGACARLLDLPFCLLLESAAQSDRLGRYSFLVGDPFLVIRAKNGTVRQLGVGRTEDFEGDPLDVLQSALSAYVTESIPGLPPFQGGAAGFFSYDLNQHLAGIGPPRFDDLQLPDLCIGFYDWVLSWDHVEQRAWLVSTGMPAAAAEREARAASRADRLRAMLDGPAVRYQVSGAHTGGATPLIPRPAREPVPGVDGVHSTFSKAAYVETAGRIVEYIRAGDIFQANLSQRLDAPLPVHPFELYRRLRACNPAPFAAYYDIGTATVVGASPERFLKLVDGHVETRPIKGTAPRGTSSEEDSAQARGLRESDKDRAENVMIVDLLRNDLSKVCRDHTVHVPELCVVESYSTVHHLVSTVTGDMRADLGAVDLLRAAFPGGSITGAPKVRAMQIIAEFEPTRRGVYTGAMGYIGFDGAMDTSIVIRTVVATGGTAYFQVGGAVVADSDPRQEYCETLVKAKGLFMALEACRGSLDR